MDQQEGSKVVADMAAQREAKPSEYTILDAIDDAQWLRRTPDGQVTADRLLRICDTLLAALEKSRCYFNAVRRGQEVFVLVQQDRAAPAPIAMWATIARDHGCPKEKVDSAYATAQRWKAQNDSATRWPD